MWSCIADSCISLYPYYSWFDPQKLIEMQGSLGAIIIIALQKIYFLSFTNIAFLYYYGNYGYFDNEIMNYDMLLAEIE